MFGKESFGEHAECTDAKNYTKVCNIQTTKIQNAAVMNEAPAQDLDLHPQTMPFRVDLVTIL